MPLYEYRCSNCNHVFEVHHDVGASPGPCPVCGGTPRRIFTSVGLIFKGSGFHTTDYRKPGAVDGSTGGTKPSVPESGGGKSDDTTPGGSGKDPGTTGKGTEAAVKGA